MAEMPTIQVDIGAAMRLLESNPDLAAKMNELAFGKVAADQLAARGSLILQLGEKLDLVLGNMEAAADLFEDGHNEEAWEYVACAKLSSRAVIASFNEFKES